MFDRIARRYDLLNHLLSGGIDRRWRARVARLLPPGENLHVLDLAAGTGDQLMALSETGRIERGIGLDLANHMLSVGREKVRKRNLASVLSLQNGDAEDLPFADDSFHAVSIAFGIRNMSDVRRTLAGMLRVLKPNGRALILEFSLPTRQPLRAAYLFYLRHFLPRLGAAVSGDASAYRYLNETIETFPYGEGFCRIMSEVGFTGVRCTPLTGGIASIYQGEKS